MREFPLMPQIYTPSFRLCCSWRVLNLQPLLLHSPEFVFFVKSQGCQSPVAVHRQTPVLVLDKTAPNLWPNPTNREWSSVCLFRQGQSPDRCCPFCSSSYRLHFGL